MSEKIEFYYYLVVAPPVVTAQKSIQVVVVFIEKCQLVLLIIPRSKLVRYEID